MNKEVLYGKDTKEIYYKFQEIEKSLETTDTLYQYFDEIKEMLLSDKSYIRIRGFRIICGLAKYDKFNKIDTNIDVLLTILDDDKPTIVRQAINSLEKIISYKPNLQKTIKIKLEKINYKKYQSTMSPLIKKDIDNFMKKIAFSS